MRMGIGLGIGINRSNYAQGIFNAYSARVVVDGGVTEGGSCVDAASSLLQSASLLLVPSGYKGGKLYSQIPTNGNGDLTWTRGSDAFRTNASGLIQRVPWNLVQQSETFSNAYWFKSAATISADITTAPNGTNTADKVIATATSGNHFITIVSTPYTGQFTFSIYAKSSGYTTAILQDVNAGVFTCNYNLSNGTASGTGATIQNVGDGWYRCSVTFTSSGSSMALGVIGTPTTSISYTGNGTDGIFIWGAQLVEGTTAQTYLPTTDRLNFPRLSYMYGSCPSVLLEPQRTNLLLHSQNIENANWAKIASALGTITATNNYTASPDGTNNASRLLINNLGTAYISQPFTSVNASSYTISIYAKSNTSSNYTFSLRDGYSGAVSGNLTITPTWQRFTFTFTASGTTAELQFRTLVLGSADISVWQGQGELGAYATTIIPTTSATATRVADTATKTGIGALIGGTSGTVFFDITTNPVLSSSSYKQFCYYFDSVNAQSYLYLDGANKLTTNSNWGSLFYNTALQPNTRYKVALVFAPNDFALYINGVSVATASSGTPKDNDRVSIGQLTGTEYAEFVFNQYTHFKSRLTNSELASLTTL